MKPGTLSKQLSNIECGKDTETGHAEVGQKSENAGSVKHDCICFFEITTEERKYSSVSCSKREDSNNNIRDSVGDNADDILETSSGEGVLERDAYGNIIGAGQVELVEEQETSVRQPCASPTETTVEERNTSSFCHSTGVDSNNNIGVSQGYDAGQIPVRAHSGEGISEIGELGKIIADGKANDAGQDEVTEENETGVPGLISSVSSTEVAEERGKNSPVCHSTGESSNNNPEGSHRYNASQVQMPGSDSGILEREVLNTFAYGNIIDASQDEVVEGHETRVHLTRISSAETSVEKKDISPLCHSTSEDHNNNIQDSQGHDAGQTLKTSCGERILERDTANDTYVCAVQDRLVRGHETKLQHSCIPPTEMRVQEMNISYDCHSTGADINNNKIDSGRGENDQAQKPSKDEEMLERSLKSDDVFVNIVGVLQGDPVQRCINIEVENCNFSSDINVEKGKGGNIDIIKRGVKISSGPHSNAEDLKNYSYDSQGVKKCPTLKPATDEAILLDDIKNSEHKGLSDSKEFPSCEVVPDLAVGVQTIQGIETRAFSWCKFIQGVASIFLFLVNIAIDINLAVRDFRNGMLMIILLGLSSLVNCFLGIQWYYNDYIKKKQIVEDLNKQGRTPDITRNRVWILRFLCTALQCGVVWRRIDYLYYGCMSKKAKEEKGRKKYHEFMLQENLDLCLLGLVACFIMTAPQFIIQLYTAITLLQQKEDIITVSDPWLFIAIVSSWITLSASLVSYHKSLRESIEDKAKMTCKNVIFYFFWRFCEVGGRALCISIMVSIIEFYTCIALSVHWIIMVIYLFSQKTEFHENKCVERAFKFLLGYVMIFCFLNVKEGRTRIPCLLFYIVIYLEGFSVLVSFYVKASVSLWGCPGYLLLVVFLFLFHIVSQVLHYTCCHPNHNVK